MSDLISRSVALENYCSALCTKTKKGEYCKNCIVKSWLNNQPTAFDTEKVVEQLASNSRFIDDINEHNIKCISYVIGQKTAIDIVKKGGVE